MARKKINPSKQTLCALDGVNFLMADVQTGVGPFFGNLSCRVAALESGRHRRRHFRGGVAALIAQTPVGAFVDRLRYKREAIAIGAALVALGSLAAVFLLHARNVAGRSLRAAKRTCASAAICG